jgi:hypothetical protein
VPKSSTGGLLIPDNSILVAADLGLSEAIEQVTFNGRVAVEVAGRYELIEFFPEGASQLDVVVVTKTGVTYVSTFEFVAPEDKGIKDVVADWIGDTGVGERFYPTCEGVLFFEDDDLPFTMAMQGGYSQSVTGSAATPVGDGWYEVTEIGLVTISCTTQAGPFENSVTFETSPGEARHAIATTDGLSARTVTAGQAFRIDCVFQDSDGRTSADEARVHVSPMRGGTEVDGSQVVLRAAGAYTVQCLGSSTTSSDSVSVIVEADAASAIASVSANTNGWTMAGATVEPRYHVADEFGNELPAPQALEWVVLDEDGSEIVVDPSVDGDADSPAEDATYSSATQTAWFQATEHSQSNPRAVCRRFAIESTATTLSMM